MDAQRKKGILDVCVLAVLKKGPSYGYLIIRDISRCIDISESTLYPILKRLEQNGSLRTYREEYNGRTRKYYELTETGQRRIDVFLEEWDELRQMYHFIEEENQRGTKNQDSRENETSKQECREGSGAPETEGISEKGSVVPPEESHKNSGEAVPEESQGNSWEAVPGKSCETGTEANPEKSSATDTKADPGKSSAADTKADPGKSSATDTKTDSEKICETDTEEGPEKICEADAEADPGEGCKESTRFWSEENGEKSEDNDERLVRDREEAWGGQM